MPSATIDHLVAVVAFMAAILLFIGLFNQTIQTAAVYQQHKTIATKATDLLDYMLLNPGIPADWGKTDTAPTGFGVQDPEFTQYRLSPFSLMRLTSSTGASGSPVYYPKTGSYYNNITLDSKTFLLLSTANGINYSTASELLGINNTYGFQLSLHPIIEVTVTEDPSHPADPLRLFVNVHGQGFPLAGASLAYCFMSVELGGKTPSYILKYGTATTDSKGFAILEFSEVDDEELCYSLVVYAHLGGLVGVGYCHRVSDENHEYVIPFVDNISEGRIILAHSYDVQVFPPPVAEINYNVTFVYSAKDFTFREMPLNYSTGQLNYGEGKPYEVVYVPPEDVGFLIITYRKSAVEGGVVMMPWGLNSLGVPVSFGDEPSKQEWVATDIRQVIVGGIAYQAKLSLWSYEGYQVNG
jgi:hypothetical protein